MTRERSMLQVKICSELGLGQISGGQCALHLALPCGAVQCSSSDRNYVFRAVRELHKVGAKSVLVEHPTRARNSGQATSGSQSCQQLCFST